MSDFFGAVFPRIVALTAGGVFGFILLGPIGVFVGGLLGLLVLVLLAQSTDDPG